MEGVSCAVCGKYLDMFVDMPIYHDGCEHYACAHRCSDGTNDKCGACLDGNKQEKEQEVRSYEEYEHNNDRVVVNLVSQDLEKVQIRKDRWGDGAFRWASDVSAGVRNRNETMETSNDPYWLLKQHAPVSVLLEKGLGINELIAQGITMDQFIKGGYNIKELADFPQMTPKTHRTDVLPSGVTVLLALKTKAHHLRDNRQLLEIGEVRKRTGLQQKHLVENMKLHFHPKYGIWSAENKGTWTIDDLCYLGFNSMDSLIRELQLRKLSHWYALNPTQADLNTLGAKQQHVNQLTNDVRLTPEVGQHQYRSHQYRQYGYAQERSRDVAWDNVKSFDRNSNYNGSHDSVKSPPKKYGVRIDKWGRTEKYELLEEEPRSRPVVVRARPRVRVNEE